MRNLYDLIVKGKACGYVTSLEIKESLSSKYRTEKSVNYVTYMIGELGIKNLTQILENDFHHEKRSKLTPRQEKVLRMKYGIDMNLDRANTDTTDYLEQNKDQIQKIVQHILKNLDRRYDGPENGPKTA